MICICGRRRLRLCGGGTQEAEVQLRVSAVQRGPFGMRHWTEEGAVVCHLLTVAKPLHDGSKPLHRFLPRNVCAWGKTLRSFRQLDTRAHAHWNRNMLEHASEDAQWERHGDVEPIKRSLDHDGDMENVLCRGPRSCRLDAASSVERFKIGLDGSH